MPQPRAVHLLGVLGTLSLLACSPSLGPLPGATANISPSAEAPKEIERGPKIPPGDLSSRNRLNLTDPCGGTCVFLRQGNSLVQLTLASNGAASAQDQGNLLEDMTSVVGRTQFLTEWDRTWTGSWTAGDGRMAIRLDPAATHCVRKSAAGEEEQSCKPEAIKLDCFVAEVPLRRPRHRSAKGWACAPSTPIPAHSLTAFPWVFGLDKTVISLDRGSQLQRRRSYRLPGKKKHPSAGPHRGAR